MTLELVTHQMPPIWGAMARTETRDKDGVLDSREAGTFLREILTERGLQIQQLAELTSVPDPDYLSNLLSGRINVGKSKHFASIARALGLTAEDVEYINPNLIVQVAEKKSRGGPPIPPVVPHRETPVVIPRELQEVIDEYGEDYPELLDPTIQRIIAAPRNFGGPDNGPQTAKDWFEYFLVSRRYIKP
ncbi:helix-turn-helix domain-containing protein [Deinococcus oregonensis]|uniref:Helix-turn-helix domain-containing protein n=1 Tax=Deinococcus oregonensis TaxID=1805970 RepID=A0ABV6AYG7_9DEIO